MKRLCLLLLAPFALLASAPGDRIDLLADSSLAGWAVHAPGASTNGAPLATLRDGVLLLDGRPDAYLRTKRTFSHYRLHFEWRWPGDPAVPAPNSGLLVHVNGPDRIWPDSYEVQLKAGLAGEIVAFRQDLPDGIASPRDGFKRARRAQPASEKPAGEWNVAEVICRGDTLEIIVNGVRQNFVPRLPVTGGALALQSEGAPIAFRHLWLEPL